MDKNYISLTGVDNVANHLIDKISAVVGWAHSRGTPNRLATSQFIKDVEESALSPVEKYAILSNYKKILRDYQNQQSIVEAALAHLNEKSQPELVDDNFIECLMDKARKVSDEQYQLIWGRILAEECNTPNTFSKSLLFALEQMNRTDAQYFCDVCSCSVTIFSGDKVIFDPIITDFTEKFWQTSIDYMSLLRLKTLGLIDFELGQTKLGYMEPLDNEFSKVVYFDESLVFPSGLDHIPIGRVVFTQVGAQLRGIIEPEKIDGFFESVCKPLWKSYLDES